MTATALQRVAAAALFAVTASGTLGVAAEIGPLEVTHEQGLVRMEQNGPMIEIAAQFARLDDRVEGSSDAAPAAGVDAANRVIETQVMQQVDAFRDEYQDLLADNNGDHVGPPWGLSITGELLYDGPVFWTLDLETYRFTGGAHGGTENQALVIDKATGEPIPVADLFKPGTDWLKTLSKASYEALIQREHFEPDDDWLERGTAPEAENYQVLLPLAEGLEVVFGQYQIGPYVIGISRVLLPYSALTAVLNPALFPSQEH